MDPSMFHSTFAQKIQIMWIHLLQTIHKNMTFAWTEMFFLSKWWKTTSKEKKEQLQNLIAEKRFEVLTGGWVMTDEATVHIYSMLDQLIEGRTQGKFHSRGRVQFIKTPNPQLVVASHVVPSKLG